VGVPLEFYSFSLGKRKSPHETRLRPEKGLGSLRFPLPNSRRRKKVGLAIGHFFPFRKKVGARHLLLFFRKRAAPSLSFAQRKRKEDPTAAAVREGGKSGRPLLFRGREKKRTLRLAGHRQEGGKALF